jgi:two-component system, sensor histidine kinase and response regulator
MSVFNQNSLPTLDKSMVFLVVDDFETMRKVTVNQLRQLGAEKILVAKDGSEALRVLKTQTVNMILSDWSMPVMTGLELLKAVRADEKLYTLPFVMITAEAERERVEEAINSGVTALMLKPYSPAQLMARVEKAATWKPRKLAEGGKGAADSSGGQNGSVEARATPRPVAGAAEASAKAAAERPTLLLVDDTPDNLMLLSGLLKDEYRVRLAQNGAKAVEIATSDNPPDLVLLDIMMPDMDGFEVAKRMREHPTSESIPVIFVTAMNTADARMKGLDLGAVDFITKPIDPDLLKSRVRNFMRYVQIRKSLQADFDSMVESAQLKEDVEHITRHDMKGPLAGVLGLVQDMITDDSLTNKQVEKLKLIEETSLQVLNMINLSSELFKIETGRFKLNPQPVNVGSILHRIAEIDRLTYSEKKLGISVDSDVPVGVELPQTMGDAMLCYSMFQNLIKNACEAAPVSSKVLITLYDQSPISIKIENKGAVPEEIREKFFDKFVTTGKQGGTGLGTYSARMLAEAQKGSMELYVDDENNTTAITVILPRAPST